MPPILVQLLILAAFGAAAWWLTRTAAEWAARSLDAPGHQDQTSRWGGLGLMVGLGVPMILGYAFSTQIHEFAYMMADSIPALRFAGFATLLVGAFLIGLADDRGVIPRWGSVVLIVVLAVGVASMDLGLRQVALPRLGHVDIPWSVGVALAAFWLVVVILAVNLFDGSDGLAGRQAAWFGLALLFCTASTLWRFDVALVAAAIVGAGEAMVALSQGHRGRRIHLGNSGSFALGGALGGGLLLLSANDLKYPGEVAFHDNILLAGIVLALPLYEFGRTMIGRLFRGVSVFAKVPDSLYQRHLIASGYDAHTTLRFVEPFLMTFAILGAVAVRFENPTAPSSQRIVLVLLLAATTCTFYRLKAERAERRAAEEA